MIGMTPADELAEIRAEIARLRLREAALAAAFLTRPDALLTGRWTRVEIAERHGLVFDPALLPPAVREDPRYCRAEVVQTVQTFPLPRLDPRSGWPIRRDGAVVLH